MVMNCFRTVIGLAVAAAALGTIERPAGASPAGQKEQHSVTSCGKADGTAEQDRVAVIEFDRRVAEYVALHRKLEAPQPVLPMSDNIGAVRAAMDALASALQKVRTNARRGDIFTPSVARVFRARIAGCLPPEEMAAILSEREEADPRVLPALEVNARWPDGMPFDFVPPPLIAALPTLPPELEYRIIGRSLVLWDHHADLIVDILPDAFTT